jgi:CHAD domain-containing protein
MQRSDKWVNIRSGDEPVSAVARRAIGDRLYAVGERLADAASRDGDAVESDAVENVHQVRVAARRADAALDVFNELCPSGRRTKWKRRLRKTRRTAGELRDLDVLLARYRKDNGRDTAGIIRRLEDQRRHLQPPIEKLAKRWRKRKFDRKVRRFARDIHWRDEESEPTILEAARRTLRPACDRFLAAAAAQPSDPESLHRLRIRGKELRYAMEIFAAALPEFFRDDLYPVVESLQEHLGRINDHATARARFRRWSRKRAQRHDAAGDDDYAVAAERESIQLDEAIAAFQSWWTAERAAAFRGRFAEALAHPDVTAVT